MNNPGIDIQVWERLNKKWADLDTKGHKVKVDFQLVSHPIEKNNIMAIDVVQHIDNRLITETVQHSAREAYAVLGLDGLSAQQLIDVYKEMIQGLRSQSKLSDIDVVVTMTWTSATSGEVEGLLEVPDAPVQSYILLNYQHYYALNALRDKMIETIREHWSTVKAIYRDQDDVLEFHFEYL